MKAIVIVVGIIVYVGVGLLWYACLKVAGDCSREEEKRNGKDG